MTANTEKPEFTPGPWKRTVRFIYAPGKHGANICALSQPRATTEVKYTELDVFSDKDVEEAIANGNLIAAAPELYEALEELIKHIKPFKSTGFPDKKAIAARDKASAALTKAKGE